MFCSFIVGPKNNYESIPSSPEGNTTPGSTSTSSSSKSSMLDFDDNVITNKDLTNYVDSITSKWARDKPKVVMPRNVGGTKKNKWTTEEDELLRSAVESIGTENWRDVSIRVSGRTGKQCRERWLSHMCPSLVREEWTPQEDLILLQKQGDIGNKWATIRQYLPGRSTTAVKNRWNYLCRRDIPNHSQEFEQIVTEATISSGSSNDELTLTKDIKDKKLNNDSKHHEVIVLDEETQQILEFNQALVQHNEKCPNKKDPFECLPQDFMDNFFEQTSWNDLDSPQMFTDFNQFF